MPPNAAVRRYGLAPRKRSVFINCPFDLYYSPLLKALIFAVYDCGFYPITVLDNNDSGELRLKRIEKTISKCSFGVHDISRTEASSSIPGQTPLPRFNMPFELGLFLGLNSRRNGNHAPCLILDTEPNRYDIFLSDISGLDISPHGDSPETLITCIRNWLAPHNNEDIVPSAHVVAQRYRVFELELPSLALELLQDGEVDFTNVASENAYQNYKLLLEEWLSHHSAPRTPIPHGEPCNPPPSTSH